MFRFLTTIILLLSFISFSQSSLAQQLKQHSFGNHFNALEASPIFNGEEGLITTPIGIGIGTEVEVIDNWHFISELSYYSIQKQEVGKEEGFFLSDVKIMRNSLDSTSALAGLRYYTNPGQDSWYGDGKVGFQRIAATYSLDNLNVTETSHNIPFVIELGHRFVIQEAYTLRMGARMSDKYVLSQQLRNRTNSEQGRKASGISYNVPSILNMSFGYHF